MSIFKLDKLKKLAARQQDQDHHIRHRVLVVDDEPANLQILVDLLKPHYFVESAKDGQAALHIMQTGDPSRFHLIISDQRMPNLNGVSFLERTLDLNPNAKRIILTGYSDIQVTVDAINRARIHEFLFKPFDRDQLLLTIRRTLESFDLAAKNRKLMKQLQEANLILEEKVKDRTLALQGQNQRLKEQQEEILSNQKRMIAQAKMAALGTLTAGIAHEIRNPLNLIKNMSQLIEELSEELTETQPQPAQDAASTATDGLAHQMAKNAEVIARQSDRLDQIVTAMINYASPRDARRQLTDINQLIKEFSEATYHAFIEHKPEFTADLQVKLDDDIQSATAAPGSISRVIAYLVLNALEACALKLQTYPGFKPEIEVSTHLIDKAGIEIRVRDNGPGIPKKLHETIFQPFFSTKSHSAAHLGLGLSMSFQAIHEEHDGSIEVVSQVDCFSEFIVRLP